jgi:hypothetical protein
MAVPDTETEVKRKVVMPPRTGAGMETRAEANLVKMPERRRMTL